MPYIQVGDESLFYAARPGGRPNVVLIHGAGGSHLVWPAELRHWSGATVYALDLPAHGKSGGRGRTSVVDYAGVVAGWLAALALERAVVVGHSMGGAIAQQLALDYPACVAGVILVATGARLRVLPAILEGLLADYESTLDLINQYAWGPDTPAELVRRGREHLAQANAQVTHGDYVACNTFDVMNRLQDITAPALVIGGTADQLTPVKYATKLAESIPGAQLCLIEGAGHMVMLEKPAQVVQAVADFLDHLPPG